MKNQVNCGDMQTRNIALDVLRLVSMLMVTMLHITGHGLNNVQLGIHQVTYWISLFLNSFSLVAVNCFVLISGYFLSAKGTSPKKLLSLWLQVWMYSVGIYLALCLIPGIPVNFRFSTLVECMCPLLSHQYWFFTVYFLLYLIAPFLNKLVNSWSQTEYRKALILLLTVFSLVASVNIWSDHFGTNRGYSLIWFMILYLIAGYLRRFDLRRSVHPGLIYLVSCLLLFVFRGGIALWNPEYESVRAVAANQCGYNGPLIVCASLGLFLWAKNAALKTGAKTSRIISRMATLSFGVYLLHEHTAITQILWQQWVRLGEVVDHADAFLLRVILVLVILFTAGLVTEFVRSHITAGISRIFRNAK